MGIKQFKEKITSPRNPKIKQIEKLYSKSKERALSGKFVIEGAREILHALEGKYEIDSVFLCPELYKKTDYPELIQSFPEEKLFEVSENVFKKTAYRENSDGILAIAKTKSHLIKNLNLSGNPFVIIMESVEKPGNLGAVLRTADAAKADAVILCNPLTDLYNPNLVRASVGCLFTVKVAISSNEETLAFLKSEHIKSYAAELNATTWYHHANFREASAILMGTEADGLSDFWLGNADSRIKIPMRGKIDSLNVSVSAAIITFEAMRQRNFR